MLDLLLGDSRIPEGTQAKLRFRRGCLKSPLSQSVYLFVSWLTTLILNPQVKKESRITSDDKFL